MATGTEAVERLALATGIPAVTVYRTARFLKEARLDLWPIARRGGGKGAAHVEPQHLARLILALAGDQPSDAIDASNALWGLRNGDNDPYVLGHFLTEMITANKPALDGMLVEVGRMGWELRLCLSPLYAVVAMLRDDGTEFKMCTYSLGGRAPEPRGARKVTILDIRVILAARILWADTLSRRGATAGPQNESAPDLAGSEAPTCNDQPRSELHSGATLANAEDKAGREKSQSVDSRRADRSTATHGDRDGQAPPHPVIA